MKRGGMYQRDANETPGCLIVAAVAFIASATLAAGTIVIGIVKHFS